MSETSPTTRPRETPRVSVIVPTFNEEKHIRACLETLRAQDYDPDRLEILIADGRSDDRTREIVREVAEQDSRVKLLDNSKRVTPCALNVALAASTGDVIVRIDAHCEYPGDYVSRLVRLLDETGADNVGGAWVTLPGAETTMAHAIVYAQTSRFGLGGARYRLGGGEGGYVDTVPFGTFRREVFDRVGTFDEELLRNQDNELNSRIIASGGKIYFDPEIKIRYFSRPTLRGFLRMLGKNGLYHWLVLRKTPKAFRLRHMVPAAFVLALLAAAVGGILWTPLWWAGACVLGVYTLGATLAAGQIACKHGLKYLPVMLCVFFLSHLQYGLSTWAGFFKFVVFGRDGSSGEGAQAGR